MSLFIIGGIQKTTLVDFPQKVAAIVFTQGCNFRCGYCHNPELLEFKNKSQYSQTDFFEFLKKRQGKLDGIVITGGEPTLQSGLYDFVKKIKGMGFAVKLDTNGTNPEMLAKLVNDKLIDYVAMDIKASIDKYPFIIGTDFKKENILKSIDFILHSNINYEFRTTVLKSYLTLEDFDKIGKMIKNAKLYYLQKFVPSKIYNLDLINDVTYSDTEFEEICENLKKYVDVVIYR
jgi:pyruvate formate lyase activating enzyme